MPQYTKYAADRWLCRIDPAPAQPEVLLLPAGGEASIVIRPVSGTVSVELSCSAPSAIADGEGVFVPALGMGTSGVVSAPEINTIPSTITAIRVTASAPDARIEVAQ